MVYKMTPDAAIVGGLKLGDWYSIPSTNFYLARLVKAIDPIKKGDFCRVDKEHNVYRATFWNKKFWNATSLASQDVEPLMYFWVKMDAKGTYMYCPYCPNLFCAPKYWPAGWIKGDYSCGCRLPNKIPELVEPTLVMVPSSRS